MNERRLAKMSAALLAVLVAVVGWVIVRDAADSSTADADDPAERASERVEAALPAEWRDGPEAEAPPPDPGVNVGAEIPPWEATPENTPPAPPGMVPAYELAAPPSTTPDPPAPTPPPDPATTEPPRHNPGGVDGERGPRAPQP